MLYDLQRSPLHAVGNDVKYPHVQLPLFSRCSDDILTFFLWVEPGDARLSRSDWPESIRFHPCCEMSVCAAFGTALRPGLHALRRLIMRTITTASSTTAIFCRGTMHTNSDRIMCHGFPNLRRIMKHLSNIHSMPRLELDRCYSMGYRFCFPFSGKIRGSICLYNICSSDDASQSRPRIQRDSKIVQDIEICGFY